VIQRIAAIAGPVGRLPQLARMEIA